jgi:acetyl esterase/lipase
VDSMHLVDPALRPLLEMLPTEVLSDETLAEMRAREVQLPPADPCGVVLEQVTVPGPPGAPAVELHLYRPESAGGSLPCIYHVHGGGFVGGAAKDFESFLRPMVAELGCMLVSVDYRLAPETRFPGAIEDCYAGLAWLHAHAAEIGADIGTLGVMGESAGGGLAAALALLARDRGEYRFAFQHLIYPMIDDRTCLADPHPFAGEFIWTPNNNRFGWAALLGQDPGSDGVSPYAAAARAEDLAGLPPAYIATGALDLFAEENLEYARRLMRAGVPVELHLYPGAFHAFDMFPVAPVSDQANADRIAALKRALHGSAA